MRSACGRAGVPPTNLHRLGGCHGRRQFRLAHHRGPGHSLQAAQRRRFPLCPTPGTPFAHSTHESPSRPALRAARHSCQLTGEPGQAPLRVTPVPYGGFRELLLFTVGASPTPRLRSFPSARGSGSNQTATYSRHSGALSPSPHGVGSNPPSVTHVRLSPTAYGECNLTTRCSGLAHARR